MGLKADCLREERRTSLASLVAVPPICYLQSKFIQWTRASLCPILPALMRITDTHHILQKQKYTSSSSSPSSPSLTCQSWILVVQPNQHDLYSTWELKIGYNTIKYNTIHPNGPYLPQFTTGDHSRTTPKNYCASSWDCKRTWDSNKYASSLFIKNQTYYCGGVVKRWRSLDSKVNIIALRVCT